MDTPFAATAACLPRIGEPAPQFSGVSTVGDLRLADFRGQWLVFFSHPADFTPVCTTEFVAFARAAAEFDRLGARLLGLSVDSIYSHIAWLRSIESSFSVRITFPVIADVSLRIAQLFGMVHPGASTTAAVRSVFILDPEQIVRASIHYPLSAGRSVAEILRLLQALQVNAEKGLATPEAWMPGDPCIVPAPITQADAEKRMQSSYEVVDWFFARTRP